MLVVVGIIILIKQENKVNPKRSVQATVIAELALTGRKTVELITREYYRSRFSCVRLISLAA